MSHSEALLISGTARHSLGAHVVGQLTERMPDGWILAVDRERNPDFANLSNVISIELDLNPFTNPGGLSGIESALERGIRDARDRCGFVGVKDCILSVGAYGFGDLVDMSLNERQRLIGLNICGHIEVIHSVLRSNRELGLSSRDILRVTEIGSLHALRNSPGRALYSATKSMNLDLCLSLHLGKEVSRVLYIAPGPIDTSMLHRNHWVSKEHGSIEFFETVRTEDLRLYDAIFVQCDPEAVAQASAGRDNAKQIAETFDRYTARRRTQIEHEDGIISPSELAGFISDMLLKNTESSDAAYLIRAPNGKLQTEKRRLTELVRS